MSNVFNQVPSKLVRRNFFNLTYDKKMTASFGKMYVVCCDEMIPGDKWKIGVQAVIRAQPLNSPVYANIDVKFEYWFVPYRLLWNESMYSKTQYTNNQWVNSGSWTDFITGGQPNSVTGKLNDLVIPRYVKSGNFTDVCKKDTIWDCLGLPILSSGGYSSLSSRNGLMQDPTNVGDSFYSMPIAFPWFAVNLTWNEFYRDENLQSERLWFDNTIPHRSWKKDYFTSALLWQQKGIAPALPLYGIAPVSFAGENESLSGRLVFKGKGDTSSTGASIVSSGSSTLIQASSSSNDASVFGTTARRNDVEQTAYADLSQVTSVDVSELRLSARVQRWLEVNSMCGSRYTEFLRGHFGISPRDEVLQRPQFIGGAKMPFLTNQVLQTSIGDSDSPTAMQRGTGICANGMRIGTYTAQEFGLVLGFMTIMPKPDYQQGINRQWLRRSRFDFPFPEFEKLSMQGIEEEELYFTASGNLTNKTGDYEIFGFQGRYDELRHKPNLVTGDMRDTFDYWHLARKFNSKPTLGNTFIQMDASRDDLNRIFAIQDEDTFICDVANVIHAYRPISHLGIPGGLGL